jgi:hypothetical protein
MPSVLRATRSQVEAAKAIVELNSARGRPTPEDIRRIAEAEIISSVSSSSREVTPSNVEELAASSTSEIPGIYQRNDNTVVIYIQTDSFKPGQEVEVSGYLVQGDAYTAFNDKKFIPFPDLNHPEQPAVLHVELPATELDADQDVTVFAKVAEVKLTILEKDISAEYLGNGIKSAWTAR